MAANDDKKLYKRRLKTDIDSFLFKFKRQYRQFPVREVTKLSKIRFKPDEKIKVSGYTYNIKEAIRKMKTTYRKLSQKIRPSYFAPTITAYDKDVKNKEKSTEIRSLYGVYKKQLDVEFKGMREDLWFCLYVLRELNRLSTQKTKLLTKELQAPVTESVVFSETDFEQNVDRFGKSKNLIFIAGLSGSGKSTKAAELAKKFHAAHIEMDLLEHNQILFDDKNPDEGNRILKEWFEQTFHGPKKLDAESKSFCNTIAKFISYIITYANTHKDQNFVVEGIQLMYMDDATINKMKQFPVIIKGTSILKSMKNAADREGGVVDYAKSFHSLKEIQEYISFYKKDEGFRKTMKRKLTKQVATESAEKVSNQEIYDAVKNYIVTHKSKDIKMLNHPMTHQTKDGNWVLLATLSGDKYKDICEELSKNIKINNMQFNFHSAYLPGDVMLYVKEDELVIETKESEDISMDESTMKDVILESALAIIDDLYEDSDEVVMEGANLDIRAKFKTFKKEYMAEIKDIRKLMKANKFKEAKAASKKLLPIVQKAKRECENIDGSEIGSIIFGFFTAWTVTFLRSIALCLVPFVGVNIAIIWNMIDEFKKPVKSYVKYGSADPEDFNLYKNIVLSRFDDMERVVKRLPAKIDEAEKKAKENEKDAIKESVEDAVAEKRLTIYEACQSGIITEDEREMLLNKLISAQVVAESVATATSDTSMSKEEQFDKARLDLYERCEAGMITIEEREDMIAEAHDTIFGNTDVVENADATISAEDRMSGNSNSQTTTPTPSGTDTNQKMDNDTEKDMKKAVEDAQKQMNDIGK